MTSAVISEEALQRFVTTETDLTVRAVLLTVCLSFPHGLALEEDQRLMTFVSLSMETESK